LVVIQALNPVNINNFANQLNVAMLVWQDTLQAEAQAKSIRDHHAPANRKIEKLMEKRFSELMGKSTLTGNPNYENDAYTWWSTAEHAKLNAQKIPLDHENVVLWVAASFLDNSPAGKWWAHRLETVAAVPAIIAIHAITAVAQVGNPGDGNYVAPVAAMAAVLAVPAIS
jgi:hypothetical protein